MCECGTHIILGTAYLEFLDLLLKISLILFFLISTGSIVHLEEKEGE